MANTEDRPSQKSCTGELRLQITAFIYLYFMIITFRDDDHYWIIFSRSRGKFLKKFFKKKKERNY